MTMLHLILPLALLIAAGAVAAFVWAVRSGQLDDVDTPPRRMLFDDEPARAVDPTTATHANRRTIARLTAPAATARRCRRS